jgi:hypothetical protein
METTNNEGAQESISSESLDDFFRETGISIRQSDLQERQTKSHSLRVEIEVRYVGNHGGLIPLFIVQAPEYQVPFGPTAGPYGDDLVNCTIQKEGQPETIFRKIPLEEIFPGGFPGGTQITRQISLQPLGANPPEGVYTLRFRGLTTRINVSIFTIGLTYRVILDGGDTKETPFPPPSELSPGMPYRVRTKRADADFIVEIA